MQGIQIFLVVDHVIESLFQVLNGKNQEIFQSFKFSGL